MTGRKAPVVCGDWGGKGFSESLALCIISLTEEMELFNTAADGTSGSVGHLFSRLVWTPNSVHYSENLRERQLSSPLDWSWLNTFQKWRARPPASLIDQSETDPLTGNLRKHPSKLFNRL